MRENNPGKKRWPIGMFVRLAISLLLIACIIWWLGGFGKIATIVGRISPSLTVVVVILFMFDRALMTYKWTLLLKARGFHLQLLAAMKIYCASMVWGMFLPTTVGADTIRAVGVTRAGVDANEVVASIVIERMFGFLSALLLGLCSLLLVSLSGAFEGRFMALWWAALVMIVAAILTLAASFSESVFRLTHDRLLGRFRSNRIAETLRKFHETYLAYRSNMGTLVAFSALTVGEHLLAIVLSWLIALALGIHVGILFFLIAVPLSLLISRIPISIDGLGTFEVAFAFLLSLGGISSAEAVAIAFTGRILQTLVWLPWWFAHVISTGSVRPGAKAEPYPEPTTATVRNGV